MYQENVSLLRSEGGMGARDLYKPLAPTERNRKVHLEIEITKRIFRVLTAQWWLSASQLFLRGELSTLVGLQS
jgi:hypothetical protein